MADVTKADIRKVETQLATMERKIDALSDQVSRLIRLVQSLQA